MQLLQLLQRNYSGSQIWKRYSLAKRMYSFTMKQTLTTCKGMATKPYKSFLLKKCFYRNYKAINKIIERSEFLCISSSSFHTDSRRFQNNSGKEKDKSPGNNERNHTATITLLCTVGLMYMIFKMDAEEVDKGHTKFILWNEFVHNFLSKGEVEEITVYPKMKIITINLYNDAIVNNKKAMQRRYNMNIVDIDHFEARLREVESSLNIPPDQRVTIVYNRGPNELMINVVIFGVLVLFGLFVIRKMSTMKFSSPFTMFQKAKFTTIDPLMPGSGKGVKLSDVAGSEQAKIEVMEFVDFLKNPTKYQRLGAKVPKGALLLGPPGCGKTLMAKAVATEGEVPFLAMNGSEFIEMIGGLGAARVRSLFKEAKSRAPCIIYIDEIDAIGRKRSSRGSIDAGSTESEQTLNQLLVEMDGVLSKEGVILLASTNRLDILDKALLRPGRFDRHIMMELPNLEERRQIFDHHLKAIILENESSSYSKRMAYLTLGFSGADIANVANEAALHAARHAQKVVKGTDLEYAIDRIVSGVKKKNQVLSLEEKKIVAYHEAGHCLVGWLMQTTDALLKVTIIPNVKGSLSFSQYTPKDKYLYDQDELFEKMCLNLGGRVAESLIFNRITTGAENDLKNVSELAYAQVQRYGFSDKIGQISFPEEYEKHRRFYSQKAFATIDNEASRLIFEAYKSTEKLLSENIDKLKLLAEKLMVKETMNYEDVEAILGPPPHGQKYTEETIF